MVRAPGNVHLLVVRQGPPGYELGEIAHIENVLKGETKERLHRRATTREEVVTRETERQEESEQDHQSTERFELQHETAKTIQEESEAHGDVSISASYGPTVSVSADAGFATSYAKEESENRSSQYAREVTDRSVSRVQERVREQRVVRVVKEIEETNRHHIANTEQGADHVVGIYRWVDKVYEAQLVEYDLRLMVEFHIPEPAAFYLHAAAAQVPEGITISRPDPPMLPNGQPLTPMELDWVNYLDWAQRYQVAGLSPPPAATHTATLAWEEPVQEWPPSTASLKPIFKATKTLTIPDGYEAYNLKAAVLKRGGVSNPGVFAVNGEQIDLHSGWPVTFSMELPHVRQPLALAISLHESYGFAASIAVDCVLSTDAFEKWQIATYEAIMRAYFEWKSTYEEQVAAATTSRGIAITGRNPQENRAIERTELKKETLSILTGQRFASFDAIGTTAPYDYPEIDFPEAKTEGEQVQFFEQAFEWSQMTYLFYPYNREGSPQDTAHARGRGGPKGAQGRPESGEVAQGGSWRDHGLVFPSQAGTPMNPDNLVKRSYKPLLKRAGLPRIGFHDLRHTFVSLMMPNEHPKVVQEMLGHSRISTTLDVYSHLSADMQEGAVGRLAALFS